jgi:hypothetical protein
VFTANLLASISHALVKEGPPMANCSSNPPPPVGFKIWRGTVPAPLVQWAVDLRDHINKFPYGQVWTLDYAGATVAARKDYHQWTYHNGKLITGICIPGITLYAPKPAGMAATTVDSLDNPDPTAAVFNTTDATDWRLVAVSGVAIVATVGLFLLAIHGAGRARLRR